MAFIDDLAKLALEGNVVDLAASVILGGAFRKAVIARVSDVAMPASERVAPSAGARSAGRVSRAIPITATRFPSRTSEPKAA